MSGRVSMPAGQIDAPSVALAEAQEFGRSRGRFETGYVVLREIGGWVLDLPPLPAGHGDYRLRFHFGDAGCLLQIWPQPRGKPRTSV